MYIDAILDKKKITLPLMTIKKKLALSYKKTDGTFIEDHQYKLAYYSSLGLLKK